MTEDLLLSLDLGTSSIKAGLFSIDGIETGIFEREILGSDAFRHPATRPEWYEFDSDTYWQAAVSAIRQVIAQANADPERILTLAISSHGETLFPLDTSGRPARPAILTLDSRAGKQAADLAMHWCPHRLYAITGQPEVLPIWPAAKIAWLRQHEPDAFHRTHHWLLPQSYLIYRLTGEMVEDASVSTTSFLLDITSRRWSPILLDYAGIDAGMLPQIQPPGTVAGPLTSQALIETGLSQRTRVVVGALDQVCAAIAAGNLHPGELSESTGSVLALLTTIDREHLVGFGIGDGDILTNGTASTTPNIPIYPHGMPGRYCLLPWHQTGGLVLKWFSDHFSGSETAGAVRSQEGAGLEGAGRYASLVEAAAAVPPGCEGLIMLPHLEGAQFPEADPDARGSFYGITLRHGRGHFVRAILESIAFLIRRDLAFLEKSGLEIHKVISLGGGAKSRFWLQIKADVCGLPFQELQTDQAALAGAAMLAAWGAGLYPDLETAVRAMHRPGAVYDPDPANREVYDRTFQQFEWLDRCLADLSKQFFGAQFSPGKP